VNIDDHCIQRLAKRSCDRQCVMPSASRRALQAALVGSAPRMSVPMPISNTIRFFVIVLRPMIGQPRDR
jgi:hypothetical protein